MMQRNALRQTARAVGAASVIVRVQAPRVLAATAVNTPSQQSRSYAEAKASSVEVSQLLEQRIRGIHEEASLSETGKVLSVGYADLGKIDGCSIC